MIITSRQWVDIEQVNHAQGKTYTQKVLVTRWRFLFIPIFTHRKILTHNA